MDNQDNSSTRAIEYGGLGLFVVGAFPLVLVLTALAKGQMPGDDVDGLARVALRVVDGFGFAPPLIVCAGLCALGIWMFMGNRVPDLGRHLLGLLVVGFGTAVLLGAMSDLQGGELGRKTGGFLRLEVAAWVGVLAGAGVLLAGLWSTWFRGAIRISKKPVRSATISDALSEKDNDGVSTAEANALVPDERTLEYMEYLWREQRELVQTTPIPPSPYPDDVRLKGEIPEGAAPLRTSNDRAPEQRQDQAAAARWRPAKAEREAGDGAGEDLAPGEGTASLHGRASADDPFGEPGAEDVEVARILAEAPHEVPGAKPPSEYQTGVRPLVVESRGSADSGTSDGPRPPRPTWESDSLFERDTDELECAVAEETAEKDVDEETIEAELDALERAEGEIADVVLGDLEVFETELASGEALEDEDEEYEDDEAAELDEDEEEQGEVAGAAAELDEEEDGEEDEDEDEGEDEGEEYEDDEAAELDEDEEEQGEVAGVAAELDEEEDEEEEEEDEEAAELGEDDEEEYAEESAEYEDEDEDEEEEEAEHSAGELDEAEAEAEEEASEPEVVLEPQPAPEGALAPEQLLRECGALFIKEGRVAVSLLQRRFALDFDEACEVLDELQAQGLIGPYMGGQRRDILLTLEEWQARVPSS
jgi:hypothetical protein